MQKNQKQTTFIKESDIDQSPDFMGSFNGYVRRPIPSAKGVVAQFYGENGDDADTIVSLSITKFQNQHVRANVFWVKDAVGNLKKESSGYPLIVSFESFIRRSIPKSSGMVANLFAANGPASDAAHELGFTRFFDSFVHVQLHRYIPDGENNEEVSAPTHLSKDIKLPTNSEKKQPGPYREANKKLQISGFFRESKVWASLGGEAIYKKWLNQQTCCAIAKTPCQSLGKAVELTSSAFESYRYVSMCQDHARMFLKNPHAMGDRHLYDQKRSMYLSDWVIQTLCNHFKAPTLSEISPRQILEWAVTNHIDSFLPKSYIALATN